MIGRGCGILTWAISFPSTIDILRWLELLTRKYCLATDTTCSKGPSSDIHLKQSTTFLGVRLWAQRRTLSLSMSGRKNMLIEDMGRTWTSLPLLLLFRLLSILIPLPLSFLIRRETYGFFKRKEKTSSGTFTFSHLHGELKGLSRSLSYLLKSRLKQA